MINCGGTIIKSHFLSYLFLFEKENQKLMAEML